MSKRSSVLLLQDILESADKIFNYTKGLNFEEFISDEKSMDAVVRNFEIIGEAANKLPGDFKRKYREINWDTIRGFRNRIVHDYFGINYKIVWNIKENFLPELTGKVKLILEREKTSEK